MPCHQQEMRNRPKNERDHLDDEEHSQCVGAFDEVRAEDGHDQLGEDNPDTEGDDECEECDQDRLAVDVEHWSERIWEFRAFGEGWREDTVNRGGEDDEEDRNPKGGREVRHFRGWTSHLKKGEWDDEPERSKKTDATDGESLSKEELSLHPSWPGKVAGAELPARSKASGERSDHVAPCVEREDSGGSEIFGKQEDKKKKEANRKEVSIDIPEDGPCETF